MESAVRLIDVLRNAMRTGQVTAGSEEISSMVQQLYQLQLASLCSTDELGTTMGLEPGPRAFSLTGNLLSGSGVPRQEQVRSIKLQQASLFREREKMIQGVQSQADINTTGHSAAMLGATRDFAEDGVFVTMTDSEIPGRGAGPAASIRFGPATSFLEAGRKLAELFTLNRRQSIALRLICRQLDRVNRDEQEAAQLSQFIGGEGGTGKSRVIEALAALFASKGISHRLLITATSGTAAAQINGITIHSACKISKDSISRWGAYKAVDEIHTSSASDLYINGQTRMDWQEMWLLIIDEVSMLGARTLYAVNEQLCKLRGCGQDFGGIPIVPCCGDFHQFRPVQERSILLPSAAILWDEEKLFTAEQRYQHDRAHTLWRKFTSVVMLHEQVRAAEDPQLQQLLQLLPFVPQGTFVPQGIVPISHRPVYSLTTRTRSDKHNQNSSIGGSGN